MDNPNKIKMDAIIVDDELSVRNSITALLNENFPGINICSTAGSVADAVDTINRHNPDILFLDVELPDGTGFDILSRLPGRDFRVIFITGHQEYALKAIKVSALDYILKPFDPDELCRAIEKATEEINHRDERLKLETLSENMQGKKILRRIILPTAEHLHVVPISEIIRAEADSNYTMFRLSGNRHIMVSKTIKEFDEMLSGSGMIRVHQSHLVNIAYIDKFVKRDGGYLLLKNSEEVPVSQNLKKGVIEAIRNSLYD
jgi:two-component system LytT family response regulator